jgi:thiosulfate/3-mercaptopyruvate sulfurtransferase
VSSLLVTPEWLADHVDDVRVLDVRGEVADAEPRYRAHPERYLHGHIPGALFVDWRTDFTDRASPVPVTIAPPEAFAADATRLGIANNSVVVAYDGYRSALASRVVWALRSYGHARAHILDGGLAAWTAAGLPLRAGEELAAPADPPFRPAPLARLIGLDAMRDALAEGAQIVDARSSAQFTGAETHARRAGHVPGARNVPYTDLLDQASRFRPPGELRARLESAGVDLDRPAIAYCNGGVSATVVAHAIELAGGAPPAVYDGSWNEWGNRDDTAVDAP